MIRHNWHMEEAGWYTHSKYGGICKERDGWYWYPPGTDDSSNHGPYRTMIASAQEAVKHMGDQ